MKPPLLMLFGVERLTVMGTDLWFAAATKLFAARVHHNHGLIGRQVVRPLWLLNLHASMLTLVWMRLHPVNERSVAIRKSAIAAAFLLTTVGIWFQKPMHAAGRELLITNTNHFKAWKSRGQLCHGLQRPPLYEEFVGVSDKSIAPVISRGK